MEIVPLFFQKSTTEPVAGLKPYAPLQLAGRDVYIREGCYNCHSQMIRPFRAETERYGHYSVAGEFVYDHPFQWGSKRTGPDLRARRRPLQRRLAPRAPDQSARRGAGVEHAGATRGSRRRRLDATTSRRRCARCARVGVPYTDEDIAGAGRGSSKGKTEMDALIAYLQGLGTVAQGRRGRRMDINDIRAADHGRELRRVSRHRLVGLQRAAQARLRRAARRLLEETTTLRGRSRAGRRSNERFHERVLELLHRDHHAWCRSSPARCCCGCSRRRRVRRARSSDTTGHVWDEDLQE